MKPNITTVAHLPAYLTGLVNQELLLKNEYLLAENRIIRLRETRLSDCAHFPSAGLTYQLSYTWSKSIDAGSSGFFGVEGQQIQDPYNIGDSRSVSAYDIPHVLTLSLNYDLPIGKGKAFSTGNRIADAVVGNWQTNAIFLARSGQPYSITADGDIANTGNTNYMRANVVGDPHQDNPTPDKWFNTAAFAIHAVYTYGNLGRNTMRSQNLWNLDLSVFRQFPIKERARFELRGEAFNLFNTVVYGIPGANISQTARFGHITSTANNPRSLQVGAKVIF